MSAIARLRMHGFPVGRELWRDPLALGVLASLLLHGLLLALKFAPPEPVRFAPADARIEIVLLNAQTETRPHKPEVLAQVDMEGGGDRDSGRARSPLPADVRIEDGTDLRVQRRRVQELEEQQRRLLALAAQQPSVATPRDAPLTAAREAVGSDAEDVERAISRLQAQIDRQISDYNKRPKRLTYGINAVGVSYARYVEDWASKIERIGTERYPPQARGRMYDSLVITVEIDKHGNVVDVIVNRKSKYEVLNRAVREIVYSGAPYDRFPPEMAREGDILQIVRTWTFTNDSLATQSVKAP
jgi:protein TonB